MVRAFLFIIIALLIGCEPAAESAAPEWRETSRASSAALSPLALPCVAVTDPTTVPALAAGAIWVPSEGVSIAPNGDKAWASLATQPNTLTDSHTGYKPELEVASNGVAVWRINVAAGPYTSWKLPAPGSALQWAERGSYALWVQADALDTSIHYLWTQWPGSGSEHRFALAKNNDEHRLFLNVSHNGGAADAVSPPAIGDRAKWNSAAAPGSGPLIDWREWHFVRVSFDMSADNYVVDEHGAEADAGPAPNHSRRVQVFVDEVLIRDEGGNGSGQFSAPQPDVGGAPPDGPVRGLHASTAPLYIGADGVSSRWNGRIGMVLAAYGDQGLTPEVWRRVACWGRPQ